MNTSTVVAYRVVVAMHRKYRQDPEHWQAVRASYTRRQTKRSRRRIDECGTPEPCGICRESRHLLPACVRHGVPAGEPCGPCLSVLDRAYLFDAGTAGELAA